MINFSIGFLIGFAACLACWLRRSIEQAEAFDALDAENRELRRRAELAERGICRIRELAERVKKILGSGETALLPPSAVGPKAIQPEAIGQRVGSLFLRNQAVLAGPSRLRRSRFFKRR